MIRLNWIIIVLICYEDSIYLNNNKHNGIFILNLTSTSDKYKVTTIVIKLMLIINIVKGKFFINLKIYGCLSVIWKSRVSLLFFTHLVIKG